MQLTSLSLALTRAGFLSFSPASLFAASEPGVWYDPSDFSTMFQDSAGTTPVTAVEQPVGLILDKSKGLVLGPELVTNGDFSQGTTGWTVSNGAIASGLLTLTTTGASDAGVTQDIPTVNGKKYAVTVTKVSSTTSGTGAQSSAFITVANGGGGYDLGALPPGTYTFYPSVNFTGGTSVGLRVYNDTATTTVFANFSVRELPGNHATQTTSTSRPVLSARYNLLTKTEQFDDAAWVKQQTSTTANAAVAPDGTTTADRVVSSSGPAIRLIGQTFSLAAANHTFSVWVKAASASNRKFRIVANQALGSAVGTASSVFEATDTWQLFTYTTTGATGYWGITQATSPDFDFDLYIWGASLVPANQASLHYQRVNTATDYDADPSKFKPYLRFDGIDDWLITPTITPGTDKAQVFAGVRKLSDAAAGALCELSIDAGSAAYPGSFAVSAPASVANYRFGSKGSTATLASAVSSTVYGAPITNVLTGLGDISGDSAILRVNGTQAASSTADQGTGNYLAYPLYIGRRGGTTLPATINLHGLIVRFGANLPAGTIASTETWLNQKTGAY